MTVLRFSRLLDPQPCQHQDCRRSPRGPRPACYRVEVGEARPVVRVLCVSHGAALAAEIGRLNKGFHESCIAREDGLRANARHAEHVATLAKERADKADARVAELKGLLREIRDSYHDNRAGGWPGAGDVFADAICRIDAALSKREGGR